MESRHVFISCTTKDLAEYRLEVVNVINALNEEYKGKLQLVDMTMDNQGQSGGRETAVAVSTDWVQNADWVVLIVAWNYGHVPEGYECSVTEWEYRYSQKCNPPKPCFVFLAGEETDGDKRCYERKKPALEQNLQAWAMYPRDPHERAVWLKNQPMLENFKNELRSRHFELFSDIELKNDTLLL